MKARRMQIRPTKNQIGSTKLATNWADGEGISIMTRETKAGLLMILMLTGVFGFMVYKRLNNPSAALAQTNPEEPPTESSEGDASPSDKTDPFAAEDDFGSKPNRTATAAAATPARIPDDDGAKPNREFGLERTNTAKPERAGSFDEFQSATRGKTKMPTVVDEEFDEPKKNAASTKVATVAAAESKEESFDPFAAEDNRTPPAATVAAEPVRTAEVDPFDTPAIEVPAKQNAREEVIRREEIVRREEAVQAEIKAERSTATATQPSASFGGAASDLNDPFEAPVQLKEAPRDMGSPRKADPFDVADDLEIQRPAKPTPKPAAITPPAETRREVIAQERERELAEFEIQAPATPNRISEPSNDDPFETPPVKSPEPAPTKSSVPTLTIPSRDSIPVREPSQVRAVAPVREAAKPLNDDRFGGFKPATAKDATANANAFADQRPAAPVASRAEERRAARPAPVAQIDEDFGSAPNRPLVAGDTYDIEPGDNFWIISRKKYGTGRYFMALAQHNAQVITDPKRMKLGVTIATPPVDVLERTYAQLIPKVPAVDPVQTASIAPVSASSLRSTAAIEVEEANTDAGFFIAQDGTPMYRIGREDTLSGVAQRHLGRSSRWTQIFELNRDTLADGNTLKIGTVLRLPADASRVEVVERARTFR